MGQVVTVVNQKGGVGKTSVTLGLASAAMAKGHKVLVVDLDPQGASTWVLGIEADRVTKSVADVLGSNRSGSAKHAIVPSRWGHLVDVLPSLPELQSLEVLRGGLDTMLLGAKTETRLRKGLQGVTDGYGVVLVDCPPSLGALTTNGLAAASQALLVVEPTALSLRGIDPVADLIEDVWDRHNQWLDLAGVIVNRTPARSQDAELHLAQLNDIVGTKAVWEPYIPPRVAIAEAAASRRPIHAVGHKGADAAAVFDALYKRLWKVIKPARA
ncbi:MAG: ParA family protein [Acidimicrobiales bacterium]